MTSAVKVEVSFSVAKTQDNRKNDRVGYTYFIFPKVDSALLYANEYKVDLIDRIAKVEEQIKPTDLTLVFKEIGKIREQIAMLPEPANLQPILEQLQMLEEYGWELEEDVEELSKQVAIVAKENELQSIQIEEVKTLNSNPLGG